MNKKFGWLAALAAMPLVLTGCAPASEGAAVPGEKGRSGTIAVVTHNTPGDNFWDVVKGGAEQAGADLGMDITYQGDGNPVKQSQLINAAIASDPAGLIVSMANADGVRQAVEKAVGAGIPVITINAGLESSAEFGAQTHIGQSEFIAGQGAGGALAEAGASEALAHELERR